MSLVLKVVAALAGLALVGALYVRMAPSDPGDWHVDPMSGVDTAAPNQFRVAPPGARLDADMASPVWPVAPAELAERFDAMAMAAPRTTRLAGGPDELFTTYVQRSALIGFPDYVSVRAVEAEGGAALAIWSRSRFGYGDMGVNRARVERWIAALD